MLLCTVVRVSDIRLRVIVFIVIILCFGTRDAALCGYHTDEIVKQIKKYMGPPTVEAIPLALHVLVNIKY